MRRRKGLFTILFLLKCVGVSGEALELTEAGKVHDVTDSACYLIDVHAEHGAAEAMSEFDEFSGFEAISVQIQLDRVV